MTNREIELRIESVMKDLGMTASAYREDMTPGLEANVQTAKFDLEELLEDIRNS
jgi:hypothetical protein